MMRRMAPAALLLLLASPAAAAPAITAAQASAIVDHTEAVWTSMDAARIKALYASGIVGFDLASAPLSTDRATWDKLQDAFAAAKLDRLSETTRKVQLLTPDIFVLSGAGDIMSSTVPANKMRLRYTDVFQRQADGRWLIVNEHVSVSPTG